ncbi:hypothetical protein, partial [Mesotoga prima]|uniref:hypothetical protein n=1 Tax=Mesotoga prima TaxID=1184387 RepID=UPI002B858C3B
YPICSSIYLQYPCGVNMKRLMDNVYDYSELWEEISPAFTEAVNRAVFVCASLLKSAILGIK